MVLFTLFDFIDVRMSDILDILLVSVVVYYIFYLLRGTRAVQMVSGAIAVLLVLFLAKWWDLRSVVWILSNLATLGFIALVIVFQPEIRSCLSRIGQAFSGLNLKKIFFHESGLDKVTTAISTAVQDLAKNRFGALIVLEKRVGLKNYADTGEYLNAKISSRLLRALFFPNSALHDGAVILNCHEITAAGCILPMPTNSEKESGYGMRHRAAKALSTECDAIIIVVSEETGIISVAYRNNLRRRLTAKELEEEIKRHWRDLFEDVPKEPEPQEIEET